MFADRKQGHSKMNGAIVLEAIWRVNSCVLAALGLAGRLR